MKLDNGETNMNTKTQHTPSPWKVLTGMIYAPDGLNWVGSTGDEIYLISEEKPEKYQKLANAEFIVRAVNEYDEDKATIKALLEAAKKMFAYLQSKDPGMPLEDWEVTQGVQKAIAQAEGAKL